MKLRRRITGSYFHFAVNKYAPLINKLACRMAADVSQIDSLINVARKELTKCLACYDCTIGGSFMTFYYGRLINVFRHERDSVNRANRISFVPTEEMISIVEGEYDLDIGLTLQECLDCLTEIERFVIMAIYFEDKSMRELATQFGVVHSTVSNIKKTAIAKMQHVCGVG